MDIDFETEEPLKLAFNCKYLLDTLRNYESEKVRIEIKSSDRPALIKPEDKENYISLIMPIQIKE